MWQPSDCYIVEAIVGLADRSDQAFVTGNTLPHRATAATAAALTTTLALAAACWVVSIRQITGLDMGTPTRLGSFPSFIPLRGPLSAALIPPPPPPPAPPP